MGDSKDLGSYFWGLYMRDPIVLGPYQVLPPFHCKLPYTAHSRTLVLKTIPGKMLGARVLKWAVHGPFGSVSETILFVCKLRRISI